MVVCYLNFYVLDYMASRPVATALNAWSRSSLFLSSGAAHQIEGLAGFSSFACHCFSLNCICSFANTWSKLSNLLYLQPFATCCGYSFWLEW